MRIKEEHLYFSRALFQRARRRQTRSGACPSGQSEVIRQEHLAPTVGPVKHDPIHSFVWVFWRDEEHKQSPLGSEGSDAPALQQLMETMRALKATNEEVKAE